MTKTFESIAATVTCPICNGKLTLRHATIDTPYDIFRGWCGNCHKNWVIKVHTKRRLLRVYEPDGWWD